MKGPGANIDCCRMLSLVHTYWQALLAQAFVIGIGAGCLFVPSVAIISTYFTTRLSTAIGIAASGSSLGGVVYPIMFYKLQPMVGFGWATRIIGFMAMIMLLIPIAVMKMRIKPSAKRALYDLSAFKEPAYTIYVIGSAIGKFGALPGYINGALTYITYRFHGPLHPILLHLILLLRYRHHGPESRLLHAPHSQRRFYLWPYHPKHHRRQDRTSKYAGTLVLDDSYLDILLDTRPQRGRPRDNRCTVRLLQRHICQSTPVSLCAAHATEQAILDRNAHRPGFHRYRVRCIGGHTNRWRHSRHQKLLCWYLDIRGLADGCGYCDVCIGESGCFQGEAEGEDMMRTRIEYEIGMVYQCGGYTL